MPDTETVSAEEALELLDHRAQTGEIHDDGPPTPELVAVVRERLEEVKEERDRARRGRVDDALIQRRRADRLEGEIRWVVQRMKSEEYPNDWPNIRKIRDRLSDALEGGEGSEPPAEVDVILYGADRETAREARKRLYDQMADTLPPELLSELAVFVTFRRPTDPPDEEEEEQKSDLDPCANCGAYRNGHPWEDAACDEFVEPARYGACGRVRRPVRPADDQPGEDEMRTGPEGGDGGEDPRHGMQMSEVSGQEDETPAGKQEVTAPGEDGVGEGDRPVETVEGALNVLSTWAGRREAMDGDARRARTEELRTFIRRRSRADRPTPDGREGDEA